MELPARSEPKALVWAGVRPSDRRATAVFRGFLRVNDMRLPRNQAKGEWFQAAS